MKKKLFLFALVALTTTLNGCSCSAQTYHSYIGGRSTRLADSLIYASSEKDAYQEAALGAYLGLYDRSMLYNFYTISTVSNYEYIDYDQGILEIIGNIKYTALSEEDATNVNIKNIFLNYTFGNESMDAIIWITNNGLIFTFVLKNGHTAAETVYKMTDKEISKLKAAVFDKYDAVNLMLQDEIEGVNSPASLPLFFATIDNSHFEGTIDVTYDNDYWRGRTDQTTYHYYNDQKPSYYTYLKDMNYTLTGYELLKESFERSKIIYQMMVNSSLCLYLYLENNQIKAVVEQRNYQSFYLYNRFNVIGYYSIDQADFETFYNQLSATNGR